MMIIGIDLGTTNSLVSLWQEDDGVLIPNVMGQYLTPSIVGLDDLGNVIVGMPAKERLLTNPNLTTAIFKRYMGSQKQIELGHQLFRPEELSAFILKSLKADAEAFTGQSISEAIITVPAYFNDTQRKSTKLAGELAGLKVERLLNEPTSAALAYGLHEQEDVQILVFDLGGGTFDVSVLELFEGVMEVRASSGDNFLGGEDFTQVISEYFLSQIKESNVVDIIQSQYQYQLYRLAQTAKHALSEQKDYMMQLTVDQMQYSTEINRQQFDKLSSDLLTRLQAPIKKALRDSSIRPSELDAVILVGGATRMPVISKMVTTMFGRFPEKQYDPDNIVALGAAVQAGLKQRHQALNDIVLTDVCPYTLGIEVVSETTIGQQRSGIFSPIIERNTVVPTSKVERYYPVDDQQQHINIKIYQGESRETKDNIFLGNLSIDIPVELSNEKAIDVRFSYDINGLLEVETIIIGSGERHHLVLQEADNHLTEKEIQASLNKLSQLKIHPRDNTENLALIYKGKRLYEQSLGEKREYIGRYLDDFLAVLDAQDEKLVIKARKVFADFLQEIDTIE